MSTKHRHFSDKVTISSSNSLILILPDFPSKCCTLPLNSLTDRQFKLWESIPEQSSSNTTVADNTLQSMTHSCEDDLTPKIQRTKTLYPLAPIVQHCYLKVHNKTLGKTWTISWWISKICACISTALSSTSFKRDTLYSYCLSSVILFKCFASHFCASRLSTMCLPCYPLCLSLLLTVIGVCLFVM